MILAITQICQTQQLRAGEIKERISGFLISPTTLYLLTELGKTSGLPTNAVDIVMGSKNMQAIEGLVLGASPQEIEQFKDLLRFFARLAMTTGFRIGARLFLATLLTRPALRPLSVALGTPG
uniref:WGS project CBMG000000000 data, contig CS5907-c003754 n=1 Tax=Fusarium acuminatum CS5907 TaxID=1318461 RepID=A0A090MA54_9HYPO|nr:unnamed protein product [Fusarium acuminatum CS5907]